MLQRTTVHISRAVLNGPTGMRREQRRAYKLPFTCKAELDFAATTATTATTTAATTAATTTATTTAATD